MVNHANMQDFNAQALAVHHRAHAEFGRLPKLPGPPPEPEEPEPEPEPPAPDYTQDVGKITKTLEGLVKAQEASAKAMEAVANRPAPEPATVKIEWPEEPPEPEKPKKRTVTFSDGTTATITRNGDDCTVRFEDGTTAIVEAG